MSESPSTESLIYAEIRVANQKKSVETAYFLWFFFGFLGGHSFYLNRPWQGLTKIGLLVGTVLLIPILFLGLWISVDFPLRSFLGHYYEYKDDSRENWREYGEQWREYEEKWGRPWREKFVFLFENFKLPWWFFPGILLWICLGLSMLIWWVVDVFLLSSRIEKDTQAKREKILKETQTIE